MEILEMTQERKSSAGLLSRDMVLTHRLIYGMKYILNVQITMQSMQLLCSVPCLFCSRQDHGNTKEALKEH